MKHKEKETTDVKIINITPMPSYEQKFNEANRDMTGQDLDNFVGDDKPDTPKHEY